MNIVELQGTVGSAPAIDRKKGFEEIIKADPHFKIIRSQTGDFTRAKGKEVMEAFLKAEGKKINVLYAHNDDMAIGAIQAIEEAGLKPGKDITHRLDRRGEGRVRGHDRRQAQRHRRMQPAARAAADERGQGRGGRQDAAQAHRDQGRHVPDGSRGQGIPEPQVLRPLSSEARAVDHPWWAVAPRARPAPTTDRHCGELDRAVAARTVSLEMTAG